MVLYKQTEWETASGWHCNCVDNLAGGSSNWYLPARLLGISPADFLTLLFEKYKPDNFYFNKETCFCSWSWKNQQVMRQYKNWINAEARKRNFQV